MLATTLSTPVGQLKAIANRIDKHYLEFTKPVKGKDRDLSEPYFSLKLIQKRILYRIFSNIKFPDYLHGGIKSEEPRDFFSNASAHSSAQVAIMMDIKSFFPSISFDLVKTTIQRFFKFPPEVADLLAKLTTFKGSLPQGAPTSSIISNIVLFEEEYKLVSSLEGQGFVYSRLIDDITISSKSLISNERVTKIITRVTKMINSYGLDVHPDKTKIRSRSNPENLMIITGLWINRGVPRVQRAKRIEISKEVIDLKKRALKEGTTPQNYHKDYSSISGKVALLERFNHARAKRLRGILSEIRPVYEQREIGIIKNLVERFVKRKRDPDRLGYIRRFYELQNCVAIIKRTHAPTAKKLQTLLNSRRPTTTMRSHYE